MKTSSFNGKHGKDLADGLESKLELWEVSVSQPLPEGGNDEEKENGYSKPYLCLLCGVALLSHARQERVKEKYETTLPGLSVKL